MAVWEGIFQAGCAFPPPLSQLGGMAAGEGLGHRPCATSVLPLQGHGDGWDLPHGVRRFLSLLGPFWAGLHPKGLIVTFVTPGPGGGSACPGLVGSEVLLGDSPAFAQHLLMVLGLEQAGAGAAFVLLCDGHL